MRAGGWQTLWRNGSERWEAARERGGTIDRSGSAQARNESSRSIIVGTRKMVNYA